MAGGRFDARCDNIAASSRPPFFNPRGRPGGLPMTTTLQRSTASELYAMPDDGFRYELVKGELRKMSPSGSEHGAIIINISLLLAQHVRSEKLGVCFGAETGFKIGSDPDTVRAPDVAFIRRERIPESGIPKKFWPGAPDLAVEVLSPGDPRREVDEKVEDWLEAGTRAVWVVNPKRRNVSIYRPTADVTRLSESDELDGGDVVPGFRCKVSEIFV
jgi:Uma2 family endonuclease